MVRPEHRLDHPALGGDEDLGHEAGVGPRAQAALGVQGLKIHRRGLVGRLREPGRRRAPARLRGVDEPGGDQRGPLRSFTDEGDQPVVLVPEVCRAGAQVGQRARGARHHHRDPRGCGREGTPLALGCRVPTRRHEGRPVPGGDRSRRCSDRDDGDTGEHRRAAEHGAQRGPERGDGTDLLHALPDRGAVAGTEQRQRLDERDPASRAHQVEAAAQEDGAGVRIGTQTARPRGPPRRRGRRTTSELAEERRVADDDVVRRPGVLAEPVGEAYVGLRADVRGQGPQSQARDLHRHRVEVDAVHEPHRACRREALRDRPPRCRDEEVPGPARGVEDRRLLPRHQDPVQDPVDERRWGVERPGLLATLDQGLVGVGEVLERGSVAPGLQLRQVRCSPGRGEAQGLGDRGDHRLPGLGTRPEVSLRRKDALGEGRHGASVGGAGDPGGAQPPNLLQS